MGLAIRKTRKESMGRLDMGEFFFLNKRDWVRFQRRLSIIST
jgi:hypothetical protein